MIVFCNLEGDADNNGGFTLHASKTGLPTTKLPVMLPPHSLLIVPSLLIMPEFVITPEFVIIPGDWLGLGPATSRVPVLSEPELFIAPPILLVIDATPPPLLLIVPNALLVMVPPALLIKEPLLVMAPLLMIVPLFVIVPATHPTGPHAQLLLMVPPELI